MRAFAARAQDRESAQSRCGAISIRAGQRKFPGPSRRKHRWPLFRSRGWPARLQAAVSRCQAIPKSNKHAQADVAHGRAASIRGLLCEKKTFQMFDVLSNAGK